MPYGEVYVKVRVITWRLRLVLWVMSLLLKVFPFEPTVRLGHWVLKRADKWVTVKVR